jgi:hypothetical protein
MTTTNSLATRQPVIPQGANGLQLELIEGVTRELTTVKIGRIFVFGMLEDRRSWCIIRLSGVRAIRFQIQNLDPGSSVSWTRKAAGELIASLDLPTRATVSFREQPKDKVDINLLGATRSLLATDCYLMPFIPIQAISYLEISPN